MTGSGTARRFSCSLFRTGGVVLAALYIVASCSRSAPNQVQGYVEGEFVSIASPLAGALQSLYVQRGGQVQAGDPLFALENT
ncbi:MAG: biotin/lipoyl-binding protein, partial [Gammaproteobacteria bacterium]